MDSKLQHACVATMACASAYYAYTRLNSPRASPVKVARKSAPRTRAQRIPSNAKLAASLWNEELKSTGMEGNTEEQILAELNAEHDDGEVRLYYVRSVYVVRYSQSTLFT